MTPKVVIEKIIEVIQRLGEESGCESQLIVDTTCPLKDLPWFDSLMGTHSMTELSDVLVIEIPDNLDIFKTKGKELSICEAANKLLEHLTGK